MSEHAEHPEHHVELLVRTADRLDELAEIADVMGDDAGAERLRTTASSRRLQAMALLDP